MWLLPKLHPYLNVDRRGGPHADRREKYPVELENAISFKIVMRMSYTANRVTARRQQLCANVWSVLAANPSYVAQLDFCFQPPQKIDL